MRRTDTSPARRCPVPCPSRIGPTSPALGSRAGRCADERLARRPWPTTPPGASCARRPGSPSTRGGARGRHRRARGRWSADEPLDLLEGGVDQPRPELWPKGAPAGIADLDVAGNVIADDDLAAHAWHYTFAREGITPPSLVRRLDAALRDPGFISDLAAVVVVPYGDTRAVARGGPTGVDRASQGDGDLQRCGPNGLRRKAGPSRGTGPGGELVTGPT